LDTTDVDSKADSMHERFTTHVFDQSKVSKIVGPSGSAVRTPSDMSTWPPAVLFDAVYASAVVHHFGVALTDVLKKWGDAEDEISNLQKETRRRCYEKRDGRRGIHHDDALKADLHDLLIIYRLQAMTPEKVGAYLERCEEMVATAERKRLEDKVNSWRGSLAPDCVVID
jgi:hypothetical protein